VNGFGNIDRGIRRDDYLRMKVINDQPLAG